MEGGNPPILTIPRDLSFSGSHSHESINDTSSPTDDGNGNVDKGSSSGYPVYLTEDWDSGIGGGLWTTGLALGRYFAASRHFLEQYRSLRARKQKTRQSEKSVRVLELGSGNGFLGVCLVSAIAVAEANGICRGIRDVTGYSDTNYPKHWPGIEVVVTDTAEHLSLMRATIQSNLKRILPKIRKQISTLHPSDDNSTSDTDIETIARAEEYLWGENYDFGDDGGEPFDLIIGSDVAYRDYLHDPLIAALDEFCVPQHTVALIGVTMNDTRPIFFEKLQQRGFRFEKLADHLLDDEFSTSSRQFGVFCISKK